MFEALYLPRTLVNHFHIQVCWSLWSKDHVALFKSHVPRKMSQFFRDEVCFLNTIDSMTEL